MDEYCCKVEASSTKYGLEDEVLGDDLNEYLQARWEGRNQYPETGVRPLKDWFNKNVLRAVYSEHDRRGVDPRIDADYEALIGDDEIARGAIIDDLAEDGIDGEQLIDDFVSTATVYRHLTEHLGAEKPKNVRTDSDWERRKIEYVRDTMRKNVEDALRSLENKDRLPYATKAEIGTQIILRCPECSTQVRFERALKRGYVCDEHMDGEVELDDGNGSSTDRSPRG